MMRAIGRGAALVALIATAAACGGATKATRTVDASFACRGRTAGYTATHHIGGDLGISIDCAEVGPRLKVWRADAKGDRREDARSMTASEFEAVWKEIDGTGWPNLRDCGNGSLDKRDPLYTFAVKDDERAATFHCQTRVVPYPYNDIADPLDRAAAQSSSAPGDDEPAAAKK